MGWQNIFGHAARVEHLRKIIAEDKFPHAAIFSGVEGIGKRRIAESCAAALLCENPKDGEPCGVCRSCKLMKIGGHPDFFVVEPEDSKAAPNIKIGQIRELQAKTALKPNFSKCRVVIIDGAELMNTPASNCLLKTLEEPAGESVFILVTANRAGLLMTVRSRCVTVNFDKISAAEIKSALKGRGVEADRAETISLIANGSFGRALKLEESGGYEIRESALNFLERLQGKQVTVEDIFEKGAEFDKLPRESFGDFVEYIQKFLRDVYVLETAELYNADLKQRLDKLKIPDEKIYALLDEGNQIQRRLKSNANLRLQAEAYLMRLRLVFGTK